MLNLAYQFTLKHQWEVKLSFLSGITLPQWFSLLLRHGHAIDYLNYGHRVVFLTLMAIFNSLVATVEWLLYSRAVSRQELHPEPVFVLGHPRTGTTHLQNLLALDPNLISATTFQVGFPSGFLLLSPLRSLLSPLLSKTRPMDNMALTWETPAEDEIATNMITGGISPYMSIVVPSNNDIIRTWYTFEEATAAEYQIWQDTFMSFLKKVTYAVSRGGPPKPLVIKSPVHTARIKILRRLFPRARFVYIHRHPIEVFQSACHMADTYYWYTYLQRPTNEQVTEYVLSQYELLYDEYVRERGRIPRGRLMELSLRELEGDPMDTLKRLYKALGWEDRFDAVRPRFEMYCRSLADFKKNDLLRLPKDLEEVVRARWGPSFKEFGYE